MIAKMARAKAAVRNTGTREVAFVCDTYPLAKEAYVAGSFNLWSPEANRMPKKDGAFRIKLDLTPGQYQYKFVVDGQWHSDPAAATQVPNEFGGMNSVVKV